MNIFLIFEVSINNGKFPAGAIARKKIESQNPLNK